MGIYFDNASTTPLQPEVIDKMVDVLKGNYGNPSSIHAHGRRARSIIEDARKKIAKCLNASVGEIYFTSSATEASNMIMTRSVVDLGVTTIISAPTEHHCVLHALDRLALENNLIVKFLNVNKEGDIDLNELVQMLSESSDRTMVCLMHGNNEIGNIHPIEEISQLCKTHNALFYCDTVQTMGKIEIDLSKTRMSFLTASAHKFYGPKGSGFLYMNNDNIVNAFIVGGAQERNMRAGTENVAGIAGMSQALQMYIANQDEYVRKIIGIRDFFEGLVLEKLEGVTINSRNAHQRLPHISSLSFPPSPTVDMLMFNLDIAGISVSSGSACSAGIEEDSHVLTAIGHDTHHKTIRFSFSIFNEESEVMHVVDVLQKLLSKK